MQAFSSILSSLGGAGGAINDLTSIMGLISKMSLASKEKSAMDQSIYYSKHPEAMNALVQKFQQPLSAGLTSSVGNVVNASLAEQGLSQAPGIQSQVLSQALAPYQQNAQQMAIAEMFKAIGLPMEALSAIQSVGGGMNMPALLKSILPGQQPSVFNGGSVGGVSDPALASPQYMPADIGPPLSPDNPAPPTYDPSWGLT